MSTHTSSTPAARGGARAFPAHALVSGTGLFHSARSPNHFLAPPHFCDTYIRNNSNK